MFKSLKNKNRINRFIYNLTTALAIVAFWRGVWGILDIYLFPDNSLMSYIFSAFIGLAILYFNDFSLSEISE